MRLLQIMRSVLDRPFAYTIQELATRHNKHKDTIKGDIEAFRNAGFVMEYDKRFRYAFVENKEIKSLKDLLHFTEEDQYLLEEAIDQIEGYSHRGQKLKRKLASLYDYRKLGHSYLRKPYLNKIDILEQARKEKRQVILIDYQSSKSNAISDRLVEPFHINPPADMVHTYDVNKKILRHFRISRCKRIKLLDAAWQFEGHHRVKPTDPFRIVDDRQVLVHLRLKVGAYNELIERYPVTKGSIMETAEDEIFDFQCMVNHQFIGLSNFILGSYYLGVEVLGPEELIDLLNEQAGKIKF